MGLLLLWTTVKSPPIQTMLAPDPRPTAMAWTARSVLGFQAPTVPSARTRAAFWRGLSPTRVNEPPMYQPPALSGAGTKTGPFTLGKGAGRGAAAASRATPEPGLGPPRQES